MKDGWLSVSEIIAFPDKPFLLDWARKIALEGGDHKRIVQLGKYAGRIMHYEFQKRYGTVEETIPNDVGEAYLDPEGLEHGTVAWTKLMGWAEEHFSGKRVDRVEYPIEDELLGVRARLDCVVNGHLFDWKSSRNIYGEAVLELGAYDYLWTRATPNDPLTAWTIVQCTHDDENPVQCYSFGEPDIKRAGMLFASMIPAVRTYKEWESTTRSLIKSSRTDTLDF